MRATFPAYLICGPDFSANVYEMPDGRECLLVFAFREHAEMFVARYAPSALMDERTSAEELAAAAATMPHVPLILWQSTVRAGEYSGMYTDRLREQSERHGA